jgi:hypothetical protein
MATTTLTPARALLVIPGTLFWALVIAGATTGNEAMIGVAVAMGAVVALSVIILAVRRSAAARADRKRIWETGATATARVLAIGADGSSFNDHPNVDLQVEVTRDGASPYQATVRALISQLAIPRIQPGCTIAVRIDPNDAGNLLVDPALTPYGYR